MFSFYFKKEAPDLLVDNNINQTKMQKRKQLNSILTLSTCWYNIKSKFPSTKYLEWTNNFLSIVNNFNLVIYTDRESLAFLQPLFVNNPVIFSKIGVKIKIIIKPFETFYGYKYKDAWIKNHETSGIDLHKKIDWKLNMLWCEKVHFVNETVTNKYFDTLFYGWCDIGYFRNNEDTMHTSQLLSWPNPAKLLDHSFLKKGIHYGCVEDNRAIFNSLRQDILNHYKNDKRKEKNEPPTNKLFNKCFAGGFFIIRPALTQTFVSIFDSKLQYYFNNEYVIKDDQTILLDCIFNNPQLFGIHWDQCYTKYDNWFMFQHILG